MCGEERQRRLQPRPSLPWQAGTALRIPPPSKSGTSLICSSCRHPRRVTVGLQTPRDRHLPPAPLPGQMLGWGEVVILGTEGIFVLNKLEEVSFFYDERPLFVVGIAAPHINTIK